MVGKLVALRCERLEDASVQFAAEGVARARFDDQAGEEVVGAGVRLVGAGCEQRRVRDGDLDEPAGRPGVTQVAGEVGGEDGRVVLEVGEPAGVVEQLADADRVAVRDEPRQPALDRVGEAELAFADQLEDDGCGVGLGEAGDADAIVRTDRRLRADLAEAAGDADGAVAVAAEQDDAGGAGGNESVGVLLQRCLRAGAARRRRRGGDENCGGQAGEDPAAELGLVGRLPVMVFLRLGRWVGVGVRRVREPVGLRSPLASGAARGGEGRVGLGVCRLGSRRRQAGRRSGCGRLM